MLQYGKIPCGGKMLLRECLEEIEDFRVRRCRKFELADIFLLVLLGILNGYNDIEHIAEWAEEAEEEIKGFVKFEFGTPSADTILRVFQHVNADRIEEVFLKWARGIYESLKIESEKTFVAIDGKTMRGSNRVTGAKGIHIVSAWADELSLVLGQIKTDEKSNEITAIPELLEHLSWLDSRRQWAGLSAVVMAKERRVVGGRESNDVRYFLTSLENIETVKKAIRRHWGIERCLHWCLDVFFGEDGKRHRKDHCPENMTVMRRIALNLLRAPEKPENKKKDNLSKRKVWFRANRKFREAVLRQL